MRTAPIMVLLAVLLAVPAAAQTDFQIIAGQPADPGEYQAMAALVDADFGQFCGATLVDPEWVMTAAHCFYDSRSGESLVPPESVEVVLNATDWTVAGERLGIDSIVIHPAYDDFRTVNDIAMLHLLAPAQTTPAAPATADQDTLYEAGRGAIVTGYGATTPFGENPSATLLEVDLPLVSDVDCSRDYDLEPSRHVCAGAPGSEASPGPDTCQGDSGGPLWTDRGDGALTVIGITSFGNLCGVDTPGVYTEVRAYQTWTAGLIDGSIPIEDPQDPDAPAIPEGGQALPQRVAADDITMTTPVEQAVAVSRQALLEGSASYGVIATADRFPDALGGSSLAYGFAPLLFTGPSGNLDDLTIDEMRRVVQPGATIYVLGGVDAIVPAVEDQLAEVGFAVRRLAGTGREQTAAIIADTISQDLRPEGTDTVIVATGSNWPDAVTVGEMSSYWGYPVLLTPTDQLHPETEAALRQLAPERVIVPGGEAAIDQATFDAIAGVVGTGKVSRLGGTTRFGTAGRVTNYNIKTQYQTNRPQYIVAVNLRREPDAFAHVLSATMLTGQFAGVFAAVEQTSEGTTVPIDIINAICGLDVPVLAAGGTDLIEDETVAQIVAASLAKGCDPSQPIEVGDLRSASLTEDFPPVPTPSREWLANRCASGWTPSWPTPGRSTRSCS